MRTLKILLKFFLVVVILISVFGFLYYHHLKPIYSGEISLTNIETETTAYFDDFGIPHIYADSHKDALTTLGYVQAQDRLWQLELMKRIAPGRLAELFGKNLIENDKFFASLGIDEYSEKSAANLDPNSEIYLLMSSYLKGINQFIDDGPTPIEYSLIGLKKEHFVMKDIYNVLGYMSFSFAMAQKTDPLMSSLQDKLGEEYLKALNIDINSETLFIKNSKEDIESYNKMASHINAIMNTSPIPPFIGSNSWVISGDKTESGKVLFANDPHIGFSQPSIWFEAHIVTPKHEIYGYFLPCIPFPLLGHNREHAYGLTMFENDDINFYKEKNHPTDSTKYITPTGYESYISTSKTIKVKEEEEIIFSYKSSRHGPIVNDVLATINESSPIALSWIFTQFENKLLQAIYTMSTANSKEDFKIGASMIHAPGLNVMYGDTKGNIAWWASAKLYKFSPHVKTKFVMDGASGKDDIIEYLDFSQNPMAENPPWNYVYSANNQPDSIAGMIYPGYYLPEDRAKRIVSLLKSKNNWNKKSAKKMINDVKSTVSVDIIKEILNNINFNSFNKQEQAAIEKLKLWDGSNNLDEVAPTIYNKFIYNYLKNTFQDEMGEKLYQQFEETHMIKRVIADQMFSDEIIWWDDITTPDRIESKSNILSKSITETVTDLTIQLGEDINYWTWDRVHILEHKHPLGSVEFLRNFFNVGPFPINGASEVINNLAYKRDKTGIYNIKAGPSTRRIIDFNDIENSLSILPTGQSGNQFSKHYKDQAEMFNTGKFRKMKMNKEEIINTSTLLNFKPKF